MESRQALLKSAFGSAARQIRESKGLSLRFVGEATDTHFTTISKLESGAFEPSESLVKKLAEVYNYNPFTLCRMAGIVPQEIIEVLLAKDASTYNLLVKEAEATMEFQKLVNLASRFN